MKFRTIIPRICLIKTEQFKNNCLYQAIKFKKDILVEDDFWFKALAWRQFGEENFNFVKLKHGHIMAAKGTILYPNVIFENDFSFIKINEKMSLNLKTLCNRPVNILRSFGC